ncbi:MAG: class I SAM-dependent methyltransferase [Anaerolineales bacterium]
MNGVWGRLLQAHLATFSEDIPFWKSLARRTGGPILELGCGAGRLLPTFAAEGTVIGVDHEPTMVYRAASARGADPNGNAIALVRADLLALPLRASFKLIVMACNLMGQLSDDDAALCLTGVFSRLAPGGWFAAELPSTVDQAMPVSARTTPIATFVEPESQHPIQVFARQTRQEEDVVVWWNYDELFPDGRVVRHGRRERFTLRSPERMTSLLREVGFTEVEFFGDYLRGPWTDRSLAYLVTASR